MRSPGHRFAFGDGDCMRNVGVLRAKRAFKPVRAARDGMGCATAFSLPHWTSFSYSLGPRIEHKTLSTRCLARMMMHRRVLSLAQVINFSIFRSHKGAVLSVFTHSFAQSPVVPKIFLYCGCPLFFPG
jgi:hypothetical protein